MIARGLVTYFVLFAMTRGVLAAGIELDPPVPVPSAYETRDSATAFSSGRFLTVWRHPTAAFHIFGAMSDASGRRISSTSFPIIPETIADPIRLVGLERGFALFWRDWRVHDLHLALLDENGAPIRRTRIAGEFSDFRVSWNGTNFLLVTGLEMLLLDREGTVARREPFAAYTPAVTTLTDGSFLITTQATSETALIGVSADGTIRFKRILHPGDAGVSIAPRPAGEALVAWVGAAPQPQLKTAILGASGTLSEPALIPTGPYAIFQSMDVFRGVIYLRSAGQLIAVPIDEQGSSAGTPVVLASNVPLGLHFTRGGDVVLAVTSPTGYEPVVSYALRRSEPATPEVLSLTPAVQDEVRVGANPLGFLAAWNDSFNGGSNVRVVAVDENGRRGEPVTHPGYIQSSRIASGPSDHMFLRTDVKDVFAVRVDAAGRLLQEVALWPFDLGTGDVTWTGAGYLVVRSVMGGLRTFYIAPGAPFPLIRDIPLPQVLPGSTRGASDVRVAFDGTHTLILWIDGEYSFCGGFPCGDPRYATMARRLSPSGEPLDAEATLVVAERDDEPVLVASDRSFLLHTWNSQSLRRITVDGGELTVSAPKPFTDDLSYLADLSWNGSEFVALLSTMDRYAGIVRLDRDGNPVSNRIAVRIGPSRSHRLASRGERTLVVAGVAEPFWPPRAHLFPLAEFVPPPSPPPAPVVTGTGSVPPGELEVRWRPVEGADGYVIEVLSGGRFVRVALVDGGQRDSAVISFPLDSIVRVRAFNAGGISELSHRRRNVRP